MSIPPLKIDSDAINRIKDLELFIEQVYEALRSRKIRDLDTEWRMTERMMPPNLECIHSKDPQEISGAYRKIHISDILIASRELINLYKSKDDA